jgi:hypothetical protein
MLFARMVIVQSARCNAACVRSSRGCHVAQSTISHPARISPRILAQTRHSSSAEARRSLWPLAAVACRGALAVDAIPLECDVTPARPGSSAEARHSLWPLAAVACRGALAVDAIPLECDVTPARPGEGWLRRSPFRSRPLASARSRASLAARRPGALAAVAIPLSSPRPGAPRGDSLSQPASRRRNAAARYRKRPRLSTAPIQFTAYKSKSGLSAPRSQRQRRSWRRPLHRPPQVGLPPTEAPRSPPSTKWGGVARVIGLTSPCTALASVPLPTSLGHTPLGEWSYGPLGVVVFLQPCLPTQTPARY